MERPYSVVEAMRLKLILLSYLKIVPESFGFKPWSPFLDQTLALRMATLPEERRNGRLWQKQFFRKNGLDLESMNLPASRSNTLNHLAMERVPLPPLDTQLLGELVREEDVAWINQKVRPEGPLWRRTRQYYARLRQLRGGVRLTKPVSRHFQQRFDAYFAYLTLKPIESLLQRRNKAREES